MKQLVRHHREGELLRMVRVPSVEREDERRLHRALERLKKERTGHRNRIQGLLVTQGVVLKPGYRFMQRLERVVLWDGGVLPSDLKAEVEREYARLRLVEEQMGALAAEQRKRLEELTTRARARQCLGIGNGVLLAGGGFAIAGRWGRRRGWWGRPMTVGRVGVSRGSAKRGTGGYAR